jgi:hypothetical protein
VAPLSDANLRVCRSVGKEGRAGGDIENEMGMSLLRADQQDFFYIPANRELVSV